MPSQRTGGWEPDGQAARNDNTPNAVTIRTRETHNAQGTIKLKDNLLAYDEVGTIRDEPTRTRIAAVAKLMCNLGGIVQFYNRA